MPTLNEVVCNTVFKPAERFQVSAGPVSRLLSTQHSFIPKWTRGEIEARPPSRYHKCNFPCGGGFVITKLSIWSSKL